MANTMVVLSLKFAENMPKALALITPKALANFSPAVGAQRQPWEKGNNLRFEP
jgi:hypothetical protein